MQDVFSQYLPKHKSSNILLGIQVKTALGSFRWISQPLGTSHY